MKNLENHLFLLLSHIITLIGIQIIDFSIISVICILITAIFLLLAKYIRKNYILYYSMQLIIYSLIPFSYTSDVLIERVQINVVSLFDIVLLIFSFFVAIKITKSRKESYINVRNKYTEEKSTRKKANRFASRCLFFGLLPLFLLIFFFDWLLKLVLTLALIIVITVTIYLYTVVIGRKQLMLEKEGN